MKKTLLLLVAVSFYTLSLAQQDPQYSHNMFNKIATNAGAVGHAKKVCFTAINRQQWMGLDGAPKTTLASIDAAISPFGIKSGVGISLIDDRLGFDKNFQMKLAYAYRRKLWRGEIGFGVELGLFNKDLDAEWKPVDASADSDEAIPLAQDQKMAFDLGFGVFYSDKDMYVGLSSSHLHEPEIKYQNGKPRLKRHYFLTAGYNIQLPFPLFELQPSVFVKSDGSTSQFSINTNVIYNKKFWGGVTYRNMDAIVILAGLELFSGIKFGYAYDITATKIGHGSHEVMLRYCFDLGLDKGAQIHKSVRFL